MTTKIGNDTFEAGCDLVDVTSMHRPDPTWIFIDQQGHTHEWYVNGTPAVIYAYSENYDVPSTKWVHDGWDYYEGDRVERGHLECLQCGEEIHPRYCADTNTVYAPGLRWFRINGESVSQDEFQRRLKEAQHDR